MNIRQLNLVCLVVAMVGCSDASEGVFGETDGTGGSSDVGSSGSGDDDDDGDSDDDDGSSDGNGGSTSSNTSGNGGSTTNTSGNGGNTTTGSGGNGGSGGEGGSGEPTCYTRCVAKGLECGFGQSLVAEFCEDDICNQDLTDDELDCLEDLACNTLITTQGTSCIENGSGGSGGGEGGGDEGGGGSGGSDPIGDVGQLKVIIIPQAGGNHAITVKGDEIPYRSGGPTWGSPTFTTNDTEILITTNILEGSAFEFNGVWDPPNGTTESDGAYWTNQLCDPNTMKPRASVWATFDDDTSDGITPKPTAKVVVQSNGVGGCELKIIAQASTLISGNDLDGDGFTTAQGDCNDNPATDGQGFYPGQIESPSTSDSQDLDCNGSVNPARAIYSVQGIGTGLNPVLRNSVTGASHPMTWIAGPNRYETTSLEMSNAPSEFWIDWSCNSGTCYDSGYWSNTCHDQTGGVDVRKDTDGTLIPDSLQPVGSPAFTCHRFVSAAQLVP